MVRMDIRQASRVADGGVRIADSDPLLRYDKSYGSVAARLAIYAPSGVLLCLI